MVIAISNIYVQNTNNCFKDKRSQNVFGGGTPVVSLYKNIIKSIISLNQASPKIAGYPFEKDWIYKNEFPFPVKSNKQIKNLTLLLFLQKVLQHD